MAARRILVSGLVQGVGFRFSAQNAARALGVGGWVRNLPDGRVEAVVTGDDRKVEAMVEWLRTGPAFAQVDDVEVSDADAADAGSETAERQGEFRIR